jgi:hypothetical protein
MNIRQIKLTLTVDLMNQQSSQKPIHFARKAMGKFKNEVGNYLGLLEKGTTKINDAIERRSFALQYEFCTLDLDLVLNRKSKSQFIQGFNIIEN